MMTYGIIGGVCLVIGAIAGALWGRKHAAAATALANVADEAKAKVDGK